MGQLAQLALGITLTRNILIAILSVCPSVRLSVCDVPVSDENGLTYRYSFFSPYGSPIILVLPASNIFTKFRRSQPCGGAKYRWGIKISRFSTNKSLYLANDTRYHHSYYGRRIGTRMRSIIWFHFQWPWTNPNPVFKVMPFFNAKYLTTGYRYGHSYYRRRIGNRTKAFEQHQFQWPLVTSNPDFKVTILFNVKKLENGTTQSYSDNGGSTESCTWSIEPHHFKWPWTTPNPDFDVRPFDAEYLQNG